MTFRTHNGEIITGPRLDNALNAVANDWAQLSHDIRHCGDYADHVTEEEKDRYLAEGLATAETIRNGTIDSFTIWQRVNTAITGKCVALLA